MAAKSPQRKSPSPAYVSIVSNNPETLDGLQAYLGDAGVRSRSTSDLQNLETVAAEGVTVAVIFPDDFTDSDVRTLVLQLRRTRPRLLALVVTREPQRFRSVLEPDGRSLPPIVLPKPSFGWDILDAIRAHTDAVQA